MFCGLLVGWLVGWLVGGDDDEALGPKAKMGRTMGLKI